MTFQAHQNETPFLVVDDLELSPLMSLNYFMR